MPPAECYPFPMVIPAYKTPFCFCYKLHLPEDRFVNNAFELVLLHSPIIFLIGGQYRENIFIAGPTAKLFTADVQCVKRQ